MTIFAPTRACFTRRAAIAPPIEKQDRQRLEPLRNWILEANHGEKLLSSENFGEMKTFLQKVGLNRVFRDQTLTISFIKPWDSMAETTAGILGDNEFTHVSEKWWRWRELNQITTLKLSR
jgi:hypothetical protein